MPALRTRSDSLSASLPFEHLSLSKPHSGTYHTHASTLGLEVDVTSPPDEPSIGIVSPTPRAFTFAQNTFSIDHLDGPTPRAFAFPEQVHNSLNALSLPISISGHIQQHHQQQQQQQEPSPSSSPSPFHDDTSGSPSPELARLAISSRRPSLQTHSTSSPLSQINPFNAFEPSLAGGPVTLAQRRRGSSISSLQLTSTSTNTTSTSAQITVNPHANAPPQTHTLALGLNGNGIGLGLPDRRPKRGDEDYIKRPENAFILFRRDCCQKRNAEEASAAANGTDDPTARRQRQADLSKTISQQWRSLSAEERKYWDDLAKLRKKEHEEMYPWYVYQPTRSKDKKGSSNNKSAAKAAKGEGEDEEGASVVEGKSKKVKREGKDREKERRRERKERREEKSRSRVRGHGLRSRNQSACSSASTASSSCSTVDSDDFDSGSEAFGRFRPFKASVGDVDMGDMGEMDFEMTTDDSESSASFSMALPHGLAMSQQYQLSTHNPMVHFGGGGSHAHAHGGHGHGHSLSAQIPQQQVQHLGPPLSFVLPQNRRSTSAPGAPTPPPQNPFPAIKIPQLLPANSGSNSPASNDQASQDVSQGQEQQQQQGTGMLAPSADMPSSASSPESRASSEGGSASQEQQAQALQSYQFPPVAMGQMNFADLSGQVPEYQVASNEVPPNQMYPIYDQQRATMAGRANRPRALTQLSIPQAPSVGGPLSAPAQDQGLPQLTSPSTANSSAPITPQRLYLPSQQQQSVQSQSPHNATLSPASAIIQMHHGQMRAMPMNMPESPKPGHDWDAYELPSWALATLSTEGPQPQQQQSDSGATPNQVAVQSSSGSEGVNGMSVGSGGGGASNAFLMAAPTGEIDIDFSSMPFTFDSFSMDTGDHGMGSLMGDLSNGDVDPLLGIQFSFDDILDPSQF